MTNSHGLDVDYFSRKMERMLNGAASYTRSEWARECARMASVADAAVLQEDEFVGDLRKGAELHAQIQRAAGELPGAWSIEIMVERHCGAVSLFDDDAMKSNSTGKAHSANRYRMRLSWRWAARCRHDRSRLVRLRVLLQGAAAMNRMVSVRTEELAGPALNWAINAIEGDQQPAAGQLQLFTKIDAEQLIEKYGVWVERGYSYPWLADATRDPCNRQPGDTREIAVYRAVVFAQTGITVSVPAELIQL